MAYVPPFERVARDIANNLAHGAFTLHIKCKTPKYSWIYMALAYTSILYSGKIVTKWLGKGVKIPSAGPFDREALKSADKCSNIALNDFLKLKKPKIQFDLYCLSIY